MKNACLNEYGCCFECHEYLVKLEKEERFGLISTLNRLPVFVFVSTVECTAVDAVLNQIPLNPWPLDPVMKPETDFNA